MNESDIQLKLFANVPINVGIGQFKLPTIREIITMDESKYNFYLYNHLLLSKKNLVEVHEEIESLSDFQIVINSAFYDPEFRESLFKSFKLHINKEPYMLENGVIYFDELSEDTILTEEKWDFIRKVARIGNFIAEKKEDEYKAGNDKARQLIERIKNRKKQEVKKDEKINLLSILSAVSWRTDGIDSLLDKTIFQLYDGFYRLRFVDNYNQIFTGIYAGTVDQTKIKLPDIDWANVINIK